MAKGLSVEEIREILQREFPGLFEELVIWRDRTIKVTIARDQLLPLCQFLKDELSFDHVSCISAVDMEDHFESVYHISSYPNRCIIQINALIPKEDPKVDSISNLWYGANYHEREAWEMMGIEYVGHPNLKKLLLPEEFPHFPLRKEFKIR